MGREKGSKIWRRATAGTYGDRRVPKAVAAVFLLAALVLVTLPFVAMPWAGATQRESNQDLTLPPTLTNADGVPNPDYLSQLGAYFDDHFAFRNQALTANARLRAFLDTSATDQVVLGDDGWLYFGGTLNDYLGRNAMSERTLAAIAHNLALTQAYAESQGARFAFTIAPNKNSLDATAMPYYYLRSPAPHNAERLQPYLAQAGVNYVDLFALFQEELAQGKEFHYLKTDSHWDNLWALDAANALLQALERSLLALDHSEAVKRPGAVGDLQAMLYPADLTPEDNYFFAGYNDGEGRTGSLWRYGEGDALDDNFIRTETCDAATKESGESPDGEEAAGAAEGSLLMFRDSFGEALIPYLSTQFSQAAYSRLIPYDIGQVVSLGVDGVVIERVERHLDYLATDPPVFPSPALSGTRIGEGAVEVPVDVMVDRSGSYQVAKGFLPQDPSVATAKIAVVATLQDGREFTFDPFWIAPCDKDGVIADGPSGFLLYVPDASLDLAGATFRTFML